MVNREFTNITADALRKYLNNHQEKEYLLVDVRQPKEYSRGHIPGSLLLPLGEISARMSELYLDRDIIFYCRSGKRSQAAALFAGARPYGENKIYNLVGGILAWNDYTLPDFPQLRLFSLEGKPSDILYRAMDLERGAYHFYMAALERHREEELTHFLDLLARAEEGHARLIYQFYKQEKPDALPFTELYESLPGEVMEGGQGVETMKKMLNNTGDDFCLDLVEMAISIEYAAYDLYRSMADYFRTHAKMEEAFLTIAQAEKEHMRIAAEALALCR